MSNPLLMLYRKKKQFGFDFTKGALPADTTLTRASTGTYFDDTGLMASAAIDEARFEYDPDTGEALGLLYEGQATNLITDQDFSGWAPLYAGYAEASTYLDPTGLEYAYNVVDISETATGGIRSYNALSTDGTYTTSLFIRKDSIPYSIRTAGMLFFSPVAIDTSTGEGYGCSVIDCGNYYRIYYTASAVVTGSYWLWLMPAYGNTASNSPSYPITGSATMCFASIEEGSVPTSFIPTSGSTVTRAKDQLKFTIPSGVETLRYTFDDDSTQDVSVTVGDYTVPTTLDRSIIKRITSL